MKQCSLTILDHEQGQRLDQVLSDHFKEFSRNYFQTLIQKKFIFVNGKQVKKRYLCQINDQISIRFEEQQPLDLTPQEIPLDIIYEDEHIAVINKPSGLVVHPAPGNWDKTLVNALLHRYPNLPATSPSRPGIVHRLDKETSGLLMIAKSMKAYQELVRQFSSREIKKTYLAITHGKPKEGQIITSISRHQKNRKKMCVAEEGKEAISHVSVLDFHKNLSLCEVAIETGRTHQIRVHLQYLKAPILGDSVYGNARGNASRLMLHAYTLSLIHPITKYPLEFKAPIPEEFFSSFPNLQ